MRNCFSSPVLICSVIPCQTRSWMSDKNKDKSLLLTTAKSLTQRLNSNVRLTYDLGRQKHFAGKYFEAIPLYRRAGELWTDSGTRESQIVRFS